jgi:hypothetical protein
VEHSEAVSHTASTAQFLHEIYYYYYHHHYYYQDYYYDYYYYYYYYYYYDYNPQRNGMIL